MKMKIKMKRFIAFCCYCLICLPVSCFIHGQDAAPRWKAGVAKTVITPGEAIWMAGYADRDKPAEGKIHDLWAKALHLEDAQGNQVLLITMDLESIPREISGRIKERLKAETGLEKEQVVLNCSHTHSGPLLKNDYTYVYLMDDRQTVLTDNYTGWFEERIVQLGKEATQRAEPVKLFSRNGTARFQVNRRNNKESELTNLTPLQGPNDYSVPVLKVEDEKGNMKAVVFGYACHPTVLSGYEWCGDYPGFAQVELEKLYPGATALFFQGAGADQNPLPRRSVPLAKQYGKELAAAVERVIDEPMRELQPRLAVAYSEIELELAPVPTEKELREYAKELTGYEKRWAESALATVEGGGSLPTAYPYPVQVWRLGDQAIVSLGGEVLISYATRLKELLGEDIFVMGYSNDVMAYIPSDEELLKGGYEIISSQRAYGLPTPWKAGLEKVILDEVMTLSKQVGHDTYHAVKDRIEKRDYRPICEVKRELYLKYPRPGVAPATAMAYLGLGMAREETRGYEQISDWVEDTKRRVSKDNGKTWSDWEPLVKRTQQSGDSIFTEARHIIMFQSTSNPPYDPVSGKLIRSVFQRIVLNDPGEALSSRNFWDHGFYELSDDDGMTWDKSYQLNYEQGADFNPGNWGNPEFLHKNEMYIGNSIALKNGSVAICATIPVPYRDPEDEKYPSIFPNNYREGCVAGVICFVGRWNKTENNYRWEKSNTVGLPRSVSSRGLNELDISELENGNLLMIMRGSNAGLDINEAPGRKWYSVSKDGGLTWEPIKDLRYDTGETFYSSATFHKTIRSSKTGKLYWIGNITLTPANGNFPRYPLQIVEIDEEKVALKKHTVTVIDTRAPGEPEQVQLSNFSVLEDRETKNIEIYLTRYGENGVEEVKGQDVFTASAYKYTLYLH